MSQKSRDRGNDWYLVEDLDPQLNLTGKNILSMSPVASYDLGKKGLKFSIIEDYYEEQDLMPDQEGYFREQLSVLSELDFFLRKNISANIPENLGLVRVHYYRIKCLMDSLVLISLSVMRFFDVVCPRSVTYCVRNNAYLAGSSIYHSFAEQGRMVSDIFEEITASRGICFSRHMFGELEKKQSETGLIKNPFILALRSSVKALFYFLKFRKFMKYIPYGRKVPLNTLALHAGCSSIDSFIKETIRNSGRVYLKTGADEIISIDGVFQKKALDLRALRDNSDSKQVKEDCALAAERFPLATRVVSWLNQKSNTDVTRIFIPYMKDLIGNILCNNLIEMRILEAFIEKESIDYVVARSSSEKDSISSMLAAAKTRKRVCFQHSCSVADGRRDHISEVDHFDIYFSINTSEENRMKEVICNDYVSDCKIFQDATHFQDIKIKWYQERGDDSPVMYIPTKLFLGFRGVNGYLYPITWYYEFQKAIVDYFLSRKDKKFIFKYAPGQDWSARSIVKYILDKEDANISVERRPVSECLAGISRVVLDYPSTSLHEVAAAGIPVMSLYSGQVEVGDRGKKLFGRSLQEFKDFDEAISKIEIFLQDPPEDYKVSIPFVGDKAYSVLSGLKREKR
jgi:hypothetical protein